MNSFPIAASATAEAEALRRRLHQQALVAEFGRFALRSGHGGALQPLLDEACRVAAEGLGTRLAKVLERRPGEPDLLVRAGVGWRPGVVGQARLRTDLESPAGYALHTGEPVISNHLAGERRFRTPALLAEHGVRRAANVVIRGEGEPFGVLEADSGDPGAFSAHDTDFLEALANTLAAAVERGRTERALGESEAFLRSVFDASTDCIKVLDLDGTLRRMNANGLRLMEIDDVAALRGRDWASLWPAEQAGVVRAAVAASRDAGRSTHFEALCPTARGVPKWWDVAVAPVPGPDGRPAGLVAVSREITGRVRAEAALREARDRLALALEAGGLGTWEVDLRSGATLWDERTRALFGVPPGGAAPTLEGAFAMIHPEDRPRLEEALRHATDPAVAAPFAEEYRLAPAGPGSGEPRWYAARGRAVFEPDDGAAGRRGRRRRAVRLLGTVQDVTARRRLEVEREALLREKDLLMQEVHHRVRNSLQLVYGMLSLQARGAAGEPALAEALGSAAARVTTIAAVHERLYRGESVQAGDAAAYLEALVGALRGALADAAAGRALALEAEPGIRLPARELETLGLLATELVTNALKHGAGRVEVRLRRGAEGDDGDGALVLAVEDEGPGFPAGFDPARGDGGGGGGAGGRSLGVRLVASLLRPRGGRLEVDRSAPGGRVVVTLPRMGEAGA